MWCNQWQVLFDCKSIPFLLIWYQGLLFSLPCKGGVCKIFLPVLAPWMQDGKARWYLEGKRWMTKTSNFSVGWLNVVLKNCLTSEFRRSSLLIGTTSKKFWPKLFACQLISHCLQMEVLMAGQLSANLAELWSVSSISQILSNLFNRSRKILPSSERTSGFHSLSGRARRHH